MKWSSPAIAVLLLPFAVLGAPTAADDGSFLTPSNHDPRNVLDARKHTKCTIVNLSRKGLVHCRAGPGTQYLSLLAVSGGRHGPFECYLEGECINGN